MEGNECLCFSTAETLRDALPRSGYGPKAQHGPYESTIILR